MRSTIASFLLLACVAVAPRLAAQASTPEAMAEALQRRYDTVRDFSATFTHTYMGGILRKQVTESGKVVIRKPGRMRWEYTAPEPKLFVSDGRKMYSYLPQDKQVLISDVPAADRAGTAALFLAGKGNLVRDFTVTLAAQPPAPATGALKLVPRTAQPEYEFLLIGFDDSFRIRSLTTVDTQGGTSTLTFENLKENAGVPDKTFAFPIPRGVDVISNATAGR